MPRSEPSTAPIPDPAGAVVERIRSELAQLGDAERGDGARAYLKLDRPCLGVRVPDYRRVALRAVRAAPAFDRSLLVEVASALWDDEPFEHRAAAVEVLAAEARLLGPGDLAWLHDWLVRAETWALVDKLSADVVGAVVEHHPDESAPVLDRWAVDPSRWVRRASLLALLVPLRRGDGDWERFCRYADAMLDEREFFVAKAIGWVVRDTARRRPEMVSAWVVPRLDRMSSVTRREAVKYLALPGRP